MKNKMGRGLSALISASEGYEAAADDGGILFVDINRIEPNPEQPRRHFDEGALLELSESIGEFGVIQPLIVRRDGEAYFIIAGERRWRAAKMAKLAELPVIVREYDNMAAAQIALIENVQREDLNPIEEAAGYERLLTDFDMTQETLAKRIGKSRSHIANLVRLLRLDERVLAMLTAGDITTGHGKALLAIEDNDWQYRLATEITERGLNVRQAEALVKSSQTKKPEATPPTPPPTSHIQRDLQSVLGTRINIKPLKNGGRIEIDYFSQDDLDRIVELIKK